MENSRHPNDCDMTSPLHLLAGYSTPASYLMVQTLLAQGKDPNCKNEDGITPVHVAASRGNYETLKLLLSNGGDPTTKEADGKTPSDLAADDGHIDCVRLLNWWRVETNDTPKKPLRIDASIAADDRSPYTNKVISSPIAQIYNSPRFFASPLKDSTNSPKRQLDFKNRSSPIVVGESKINKSWRKIDLTGHVDDRYQTKKDADSNVDRISLLTNDESPTSRENFIDRQSLITNDESPTHRPKFVEFHDRLDYVQFQTSNRSSPVKIPVVQSPKKKIESPKKNPFFELSCCTTSCNSISSSEPSQSARNDDATPSVLNDTLTSTALFNVDVSFDTVFSEELSKILRINTSTPMPPADEKIPNVIEFNKIDDAEAENSLKTILEQSLRRDRSEIENIDPKRLSFCKKLTDAELRSELTRNGYEVGPITNGTRWLYVRRLALTNADEAKNGSVPKYSIELEKLFRGTLNLLDAIVDEKEMCNFFESPEKHWREGRLKMSFCYLLLDPTTYSSVDVDQMDDENFLRTFVKSIFYVGKGKKSRPLQHLTDAARVMNANHGNNIGPKIQKILHLWNIGEGVISLHIFQNTIPVEAYTREAAMIDAVGIHNLTNVKRGDYYGLPANWNVFKRRRFGAYLLKTAAAILKLEGRRPLKLNDVVALD